MTDKSKPDQPPVISDAPPGVCDGLAEIVGGHTYANVAKPDRQDGDGLPDITPEMAAAGRKALAIVADRMEEAKLLTVSSIDFWQRVGHEPANEIYRAMRSATPQPAPDAMLSVQGAFYDRAKRESVAPVPSPDGAGERLAAVQSAADDVVSRVAEYDDRTSPEDFPEALLITPSELHSELVRFAKDIGALPVQPGAGEY